MEATQGPMYLKGSDPGMVSGWLAEWEREKERERGREREQESEREQTLSALGESAMFTV